VGWKEPLRYNPSFSCIGNLKILHGMCVTKPSILRLPLLWLSA
jgi:hypothetical protein